MKVDKIKTGSWYSMNDDSTKQVVKLMQDFPRPGAIRVIAREIDDPPSTTWIYSLTEFARKADGETREPKGHCRTCNYFHGDPKGRGACHYGLVSGVSAKYGCNSYEPNYATRLAKQAGGQA